MSLRSTGMPSAWQIYCCLRRDLSGRCSMLKEMPELRAPENNRTGMEINPNVKCPDQTEDGIVSSCCAQMNDARRFTSSCRPSAAVVRRRDGSLPHLSLNTPELGV